MPDVMTGTNTDKIDQLIQHVADLKATTRLYQWLMGLGFPVLISMSGVLLNKVSFLESEIRVINERLKRVEDSQEKFDKELRDQRERVIRLEAQQKK